MRPGLADPLIALLGARWALGAPPVGAAWFDGSAVGFALADGTVAIARAGWEGAATVRPRPAGGVELVPAEAPPPPVVRVGVHEGPCLAVASGGAGVVLTGGQDGRVAALEAAGGVSARARYDAPVTHLAGLGAGGLACAVGVRVHRVPGGHLDLSDAVRALAVDSSGAMLAIAHAGGVTLWAEQARLLPVAGTAMALAWSGDRLAAGLAEGGVQIWRFAGEGAERGLEGDGGTPGVIGFAADGAVLAASGGPRVTYWRIDPGGSFARGGCGVASTEGVTCIACHPMRPLIAAGYANGAVLLCQPEAADILFVREAGGGACTTLAWSPDGTALALAVAGGEVGVVAFPELMFRGAGGRAS